MASTFQMQPLYRQMPLTVDTAHAQSRYFEDEDSSILDDSILDQSAVDSSLEMSPAMVDSRRESFAMGPSLFSPKQEDWQSVDMQSVPSNNPFLDQNQHQHQHQHQAQQQQQHPQHHQHQQNSNNPFMRLDHHHPQQQQQFAPQQSWSAMGTSTPTSAAAAAMQAFDGLPAEFDHNQASVFQRNSMGSIPFSNPSNHVTMFSTVSNQSSVCSLPSSPQKEQWSGNMAMNKKMRPNSPAIRSHNELRKGDGIRKKNARFEIPAERNLSNIDQLIAQSTDEQEIKELKQQKRLLRNRQAALDSRQRKKQHTERLEDEKKVYAAHIQSLEEELEECRAAMSQLMADKQQQLNFIEVLQLEKEEMIRRHTVESTDLRKKVKFLTTHIESMEGSGMSVMSPSAPGAATAGGFAGGFGAEMEGLSMDGGSWDNMGFMGDFSSMEPHPQPHQLSHPHSHPHTIAADVKQELQSEMQVVVAKKNDSAAATANQSADAEKASSQGGLLFMLFLVGALVCSSRSAASIPRVSEDVRAASASILENVIKDAGVAESAASFGLAAAPQPSGGGVSLTWPEPAPMPSSSAPSSSAAAAGPPTGLDGLAPSILGELSDSLTRPTAKQSKEQLFSMTAAQYSGMTSQDFLQGGNGGDAPQGGERSTSQGRRNLAEALASVRQGSKAEVYTRSLLWDQIPSDVVRTFVKMVADCNNNNTNNNNQNGACAGSDDVDV